MATDQPEAPPSAGFSAKKPITDETENTPIFAPDSFASVVLSWRRWWRDAVVGTVHQADVIEKRREDCTLSARYLFMIAMSAGIAILGMLQSSTAVVIGAMLLSPLMGPIMGLGFALAIGDYSWMRQSIRSLIWGTLIGIALCALIVFLSPLQQITPEIATRTKPSLLDLLVALFSALAGAYAMIRGREGTIVGVAIATALMPPLAAVGYGLATFNWTVFSGALLLYVTNLITIALTATAMARLYGFSATLSERQTRLQTVIVVSAFIGLAVPLGFALRDIAWEANAQRQINNEILEAFGSDARMSSLNIDWDGEPLGVDATVLTPRIETQAELLVSRGLRRELDREVNVTLTQYQVGTGSSAAEAAQLTAARAREEAAATERADDLAQRLALVAGVPMEEVMVDRQRRRAMVSVGDLEGASLATYRTLEQRIAKTEPKWRVEMRPPARALPEITFARGELAGDAMDGAVAPLTLTREGRAALDLTKWAAERIDAPLTLSGPAALIDEVEVALQSRGISVRGRVVTGSTSGDTGVVIPRWAAPGE